MRYYFHSGPSVEEVSDEFSYDLSESGEKENIHPYLPSPMKKKSCTKGKAPKDFVLWLKPTNIVSVKGTRAAKYNAKDLLILSQSFIRCSENAIDGTSQKRKKFWDDIAVTFNELKNQKEAFDARHLK